MLSPESKQRNGSTFDFSPDGGQIICARGELSGYVVLLTLETVKTYGKAGRPKGATGTPEAETEKAFKTIFDVVPELAGKYNDLSSDLFTNKDYLKDLGRKKRGKETTAT